NPASGRRGPGGDLVRDLLRRAQDSGEPTQLRPSLFTGRGHTLGGEGTSTGYVPGEREEAEDDLGIRRLTFLRDDFLMRLSHAAHQRRLRPAPAQAVLGLGQWLGAPVPVAPPTASSSAAASDNTAAAASGPISVEVDQTQGERADPAGGWDPDRVPHESDAHGARSAQLY
ncbi:hypothetical protein K438DRAFT_1648118, partial [Mycena galopus ATCC 62051]